MDGMGCLWPKQMQMVLHTTDDQDGITYLSSNLNCLEHLTRSDFPCEIHGWHCSLPVCSHGGERNGVSECVCVCEVSACVSVGGWVDRRAIVKCGSERNNQYATPRNVWLK